MGGFGYCSFKSEKDALNVKEKMDGNMFRGRKLIIHFAMHKIPPSPEQDAIIAVAPKSEQGDSFPQFKKTSECEPKPEKKKDDTLAKPEIFLPKDILYSSFADDCLPKRSDSDTYASPFEFGFAIPLSSLSTRATFKT